MISKKVLEELGFERVGVDDSTYEYYYSLNIGDINFHSNVGERNFTVSMLHSSTMEMIDEADFIVLVGILKRSTK
jgi:hypothetical protein